MDIETQVVKEYKEFITNNSKFGEKCQVLPSTPQSFSKFPTIVIRERNNKTNVRGTTLDRIEYVDDLVYQVDIYTKDMQQGNTKYSARTILNELKDLTFDFIRKSGFNRDSGTRIELIDTSIQRYTIVFSGKIRNWNLNLI